MDDRFESGRTIGAYRIVRPLGSGGMGAVYEVEHLQLRTHRALKVFAVEGENVELHRKRFLSEGKMLAALDHPRVVHVHEFDVDAESGRPYFVMDLVLSPDGTPHTLADAVGSEGADEKRAAALFRDVCEGLDYVHSLGIVHRDIKLENILIGPDGRAILSDFGISRIFDDELRQKLDITLTMPQDESVIRRLGSAFYLAPEQQGETPEKATPASDAWALGVMMFRFLTGFWFERANREKCLALLVDCELPWRQLIARLCAETSGGRVPERGFVSLAEGLCPSDSNRTIRGSRWLKRSIWGVASICVLAFLVVICKMVRVGHAGAHPITGIAWGWIYLGAFLMLAELLLPGFVIFFFGLAAVSVGGCCFVFGDAFGASWQLAAFSGFSVVYLMMFRRLLKKVFCGTRETADVDFCHDAVGRFGTVTVAIEPSLAGRVMVGDAEWTAVADDPVSVGAPVKVILQQNLTLKVKEVK